MLRFLFDLIVGSLARVLILVVISVVFCLGSAWLFSVAVDAYVLVGFGGLEVFC